MGFSTVGIQGSGTAGLLAAFTAPTRIGNALANGVGVLTNDGAGNLSWGAGASSKWNALTAPDGNLAMAHAGYTTAFTWNAATGAGTNLFTLQDTAANTGTGSLLNVVTGAAPPGTMAGIHSSEPARRKTH